MGLAYVKEVLRPTSLVEALHLLQERGEHAQLLGGGLALVLHPPPQVESLIDLCSLPLGYVKGSEGSLVIGATITLREVLEHPLVVAYLNGVIPEMLRQVASPLLRNLATIGGTLASANPWSDVITLFLALDARVTLFDGEERTIPLSEIYPTRSRLQGVILTEVLLPAPASDTTAVFYKFSRTGFDVALLNCACFAQVNGTRCKQARIVVGGTPRLAAALPRAEEALVGAELTDATIDRVAQVARDAAKVREDRRGSAEYRKQLVYVGVKRCLAEIKDRLVETLR